ncbi:ATP-binding protein [Microbispora sp. H10670]|uniref:ATP-binding protein n=1 Tax=Microbispora sp. H10670 TaxID=2729108 RepID=UPI001600E9EB|nr:ATP-binding protein [Microbispora sp. H10670]
MSLPFGAAPVDPAPVWTAECLLPAVGASVATARSLVRRELGRWGLDTLVDDCCLIVSELASNVVRHGGNVFTLRLGSNGCWVYGEVFDQGDGVPCQRDADPESVSGRGLLIVDELADDWGVAAAGRGGKTVWFLAGTGSRSLLPVVPHQSRIAVC